jgi:WD40 repeat protein
VVRIAHEKNLAQRSVTRLELEKAEQSFEKDDSSTALVLLAKVLRREPENRVAAERILWALSYRNFCLPALVLRHSRPVLTAAYSGDGSRIITGSEDGTAQLWSSSTESNCQLH